MGPASSSALRADKGADPAARHGAGEDAYGSLAGLGGPKKFKKQPVLVLDPEELERAHLMFQEASAELLGEEVERPARPSSILGLGAINEDDFSPEDMGQIDEDIAEDEDEALPSAEDVLRMTASRAPVETDAEEEAFAVQMLEEGLDFEHRIFPSLPMKSEEELAAEEEAELAAIRAASALPADEPAARFALPDEDFDKAEELDEEETEATAAMPALSTGPVQRAPYVMPVMPAPLVAPPPASLAPMVPTARPSPPAQTAAVASPKQAEADAPPKVPSAYVPQIPPRLDAAPPAEDEVAALPLPEFGWTAPRKPEPRAVPAPEARSVDIPEMLPTPRPASPPIQATPTFDDWDDFGGPALPPLPGEPVGAAPEPGGEPDGPTEEPLYEVYDAEPEAGLEFDPEPGYEQVEALDAFYEPEPEPYPEPTFAALGSFARKPAPAPEWEPESEREPFRVVDSRNEDEVYEEAEEDDPSWTPINDEPVDGHAFMYASKPRARRLHALPEGESNSLRARLIRERQHEAAQARADERRSRSLVVRFWNWLRGLFG